MCSNIPPSFQSIERRSPAKVNLRLKVTGRRADGYHLLSMLNCLTAFADLVQIAVKPQSGITIAVEWLGSGDAPDSGFLNNPERNIAARAAQLFFDLNKLSFGAEIVIQKRIPLGGGLGGGSGNAAQVLNVLSEIFADIAAIKRTELLAHASQLGADVPYMMEGGLGVVGGIGEQLSCVRSHPLKDEPIWLLLPSFGVSTGDVFSLLRQSAESEFAADPHLSISLLEKTTREGLLGVIENDLFKYAEQIAPNLKIFYQSLAEERELLVSMSGSGSTFFVLAREKPRDLAEINEITEKLCSILAPQGIAVISTVIL